jgi:hypothetical protein
VTLLVAIALSVVGLVGFNRRGSRSAEVDVLRLAAISVERASGGFGG